MLKLLNLIAESQLQEEWIIIYLNKKPKSENLRNNKGIITQIAARGSIRKLIKDRKRGFSLGGRKTRLAE